MPVAFYNVKKREKVEISDENIQKVKYERNGTVRYAFKAVDDDGTKLTLFVNQEKWEQHPGEEVEPEKKD